MVSHRFKGFFVVLVVPARAYIRFIEGNRPGVDSLFLLQTEVETDRAAVASKEEWHKRYEKTFTIELNMTAAHEGRAIGADLWSQSDHDPLAVLKVGEASLVEDWNRAHPDESVKVGDEIVRVGDVRWKHHNQLFVNYLKEQFGVLKQQRPGMKRVLELRIQRPRHSNVRPESAKPHLPTAESAKPHAPNDTQSQSLHGSDTQVSTKVFEVELDPTLAYSMVDQNFNTPTAGGMTVSKISLGSPLYAFNAENPANPVQVGDTVIAVNGAAWFGDAMHFLQMHKTVAESRMASFRRGKPEDKIPHVPLKLRMRRTPAQPTEKQ